MGRLAGMGGRPEQAGEYLTDGGWRSMVRDRMVTPLSRKF